MGTIARLTIARNSVTVKEYVYKEGNLRSLTIMVRFAFLFYQTVIYDQIQQLAAVL